MAHNVWVVVYKDGKISQPMFYNEAHKEWEENENSEYLAMVFERKTKPLFIKQTPGLLVSASVK